MSGAARSNAARRATARRLGVAGAFLAPNLIGFCAFTLGPLVMSLALAFSNWDLRRHNMFHPGEPLRFVGVENFARLFREPEAWRFFWNTLVLMSGIPFAIAGSLGVALLLNRELRGPTRRATVTIVAAALALVAVGAGVLLGAGASPLAWLIGALFAAALIGGVALGGTVYRTLLYLPSFTAGVATILLWKNLFNPNTGPINAALAPVLDVVTHVTRSPASRPVLNVAFVLAVPAALSVFAFAATRALRAWRDGDLGTIAVIAATLAGAWPFMVFASVSPSRGSVILALLGAAAVVVGVLARLLRPRAFASSSRTEGLGGATLVALVWAVAQLAILMLGLVAWHLPAWAADDGLRPPGWHTDFVWAKPAIILIGLWAAVGSNNMLLYLAGLSGVPAELYEAADLDGASPRDRFWHVTWPQLAPTTFFIVVMSVIGGLQGGFELARALTRGGPDGATTTLSYFIYTEGFETGRLGYSSAIAWLLFALVLAVTLVNWKFGGRYVDE